jgi:hypothetical protein
LADDVAACVVFFGGGVAEIIKATDWRAVTSKSGWEEPWMLGFQTNRPWPLLSDETIQGIVFHLGLATQGIDLADDVATGVVFFGGGVAEIIKVTDWRAVTSKSGWKWL